jgi:glycosyltransferase involved in cell wall biosynthesis
MTSVKVTIIMPVFNAAHMVVDALRSVEAQDFPRDQMQIIVGDNGSTDNTPELISELFPEIEIATTSSRGCGYARNAALALARGQFICCTDADCVADPGWVSALVKAFEASPPSVACLGGEIKPYRTKTVTECFRHVWIQPGFKPENKDELLYAATPNAAFRREIFDTIGLFDGSLGFPDADMGLRLAASGFTTRYVPDAIVRHRNAVTVTELYRHRLKYGVFMTRLARKHPGHFGDPDTSAHVRLLAYRTLRRVIGDLLKLPSSIIMGGGSRGTRLWPFLDAVLAIANYVGVCRAVQEGRT